MSDTGGTQLDMRRVNANLRRLAGRAPDVAERAAKIASEAFIAEAQNNAPVKTGFLKDSDFNTAEGRGRRFGFGASYAAAVEANHPTKSGFLRRAILENSTRFIGEAIKRALADRGGAKR